MTRDYMPRRSFLAEPRHRPTLYRTAESKRVVEEFLKRPPGTITLSYLMQVLGMERSNAVARLRRLEDLELIESRIAPTGRPGFCATRRIYWLNPHDGVKRAETWLRRGGQI